MIEPGEPLRVGAMLDGLVVAKWEERLLAQLEEAPFVDLRLFVLNGAKPGRRRLRGRAGRAVFTLYERLDDRLFAQPGDAFERVDLRERFDGVRRLTVVPDEPAPGEQRFSDADVAAIGEEQLDVLLQLGFGTIRGAILDAARFGVWAYHHGDERYRGGPPFFWEMAEGNPVSGLALQILDHEPGGERVIYRSLSATDLSSRRRGRSLAYSKGAQFVLRRLRDLHEGGPEALPDSRTDTPQDLPVYTAPSNLAAARFMARTWGGIARRALSRRRVRDEWTIGWRERQGPPGEPGQGRPFTLLDPPPGRFHADPFLLERNGQTFLFLEDFSWATDRAHIAVTELGPDGPGELRPILERPYHLSYPFVFEHDGDAFLVPESAAAEVVELYRAIELPHRWELVRVLLSGVRAYDATLLERDGRWWLFTTIAAPGGSSMDELFVFHADSLAGEWTPHARNPVVSDVRVARPAGRVFERDGRLIRPAQDCSGRYGRALIWREIDVLTPEDYEEHTAGVFEPSELPGTSATHTYDFSERYEVIDAQRPLRKDRA